MKRLLHKEVFIAMAVGAALGLFQGGREKNILLGILIGASIGLVVGLLGRLTRERTDDNGEH
jgi:NhaP-type Na+/H+ or K+/H+ antiporter